MSTSTEPAMSPPSPVPPPSPPTPRPHEQKSIRIITWNVNSVKTVRQYHPWCDLPSFGAMINQLHADVVCVQETKLARTAVTREYALVDADYDAYFAFCERIGKRGYSGVATYCRRDAPCLPVAAYDSLQAVDRGFFGGTDDEDDEQDGDNAIAEQRHDEASFADLDKEGRLVVTDHGLFVLFNVYFPNGGDPERMPFKMTYSRAIQHRVDRLVKRGRHVIVVGDVNVAHRAVDHCDPAKSMRELGITEYGDTAARRWFDKFVYPRGAMVDVFRDMNPEARAAFTHWDTYLNARPANYGTRIDYILVDRALRPHVTECTIESTVMGSDHCPVAATLNLSALDLAEHGCQSLATYPQYKPPPLCARYYDEFKETQRKISSFFVKGGARGATVMDTAAATAAATTAKGNGRGRPPVKQAKLDAFVKRSTASPSMAASKTSAPPSSSTTPGSSLPQDYAELLATSSTITSLPPEFRTDDESVRQQKWAALPFNAKKPPPLCPGHGEPCREQTVIKNGPNKGRRFYACARPNVVAGDGGETHGDQRGGGSGDQGNINSGPCKFFQWARDAGTKRKADGDDAVM